MQANSADAIHAIFTHGLAVRERVDGGELLDRDALFEEFQKRLATFSVPVNSHATTEFVLEEATNADERGRLTRDTVRYVLACWLDAILVDMRSERSIEADLFGTTDAARFWDEARYAETRGDLDALEVIYLCVMLGFRGQPGNEDSLDAWVSRIRTMLDEAPATRTMPASRPQPRRDRADHDEVPMQRMIFSLLATVSLVAPAVAVLWWRHH